MLLSRLPFSFPGSAAGKIVSALSISNGSGTAPYRNGAAASNPPGDGFGKFSFWFFNAGFLGGFPDRYKITVETDENGENGKTKTQGRKNAPSCLLLEYYAAS